MSIAARYVWMGLCALFALWVVVITGCAGGGDDDDDDGKDSADDDQYFADDDSDDDDDDGGDDDGYGGDDDADDDSDDDASDDDWFDDDEPVDDDEPEIECPGSTEPVTLYLSADDSNSQASPVVARAIIRQGGVMPPGKIRTYEFTNYYQIEYPYPANGRIHLEPQMRVREDSDYALEYTLQIGAQGHRQNERRPMNLTFSMDTSGSMTGPSIELLREVGWAIAGQLHAGDIVSIVEWDDVIHVPLESHVVSGPNDPTLMTAIGNLEAGGSTDLHGGLVRAYALANANYDADRLNRVIFVSDGQANTGVTEHDIIAAAADDSEGEGIYLVGVGVGDAYNYFNDSLMDDVTDAGKGAYLYIDSADEAALQFTGRFNENLDVAALDVRVDMTLPYYLIMHEFHGEEYSENPEEVEPQHLGPNDAMVYHQYLVACDETLVNPSDEIDFGATYTDPFTLVDKTEDMTMTIGELLAASADQLLKGDAIVSYAEALKKIGEWEVSDTDAAIDLCQTTRDKVAAAALALDDDELEEIVELLETLGETLMN